MSWKCSRCHVLVADYINRCSFCSKPREMVEDKRSDEEMKTESVTKALHSAIDRLSPQQKNRLWSWLESNMI